MSEKKWSGCEIAKCKWYVGDKCTYDNSYCALRYQDYDNAQTDKDATIAALREENERLRADLRIEMKFKEQYYNSLTDRIVERDILKASLEAAERERDALKGKVEELNKIITALQDARED